MKANNAEITGGIVRDLITMGYGRSGSARVQDGDVRGKSQECSCLRVFGTDRGPGHVCLEHLAEEALSHVRITLWTQHNIKCLTLEIHDLVEIVPLLLDLDIGLINAIGIVGDVQVWLTLLVEFWSVVLDPAEHGCMVNLNTSFLQEFFDITIAQCIAQIPSHGVEDDVGFKVTLFEQGRIMHGRFPRIWGRDYLTRCSRSPAILTTEPLGERYMECTTF